MTLIRIPIHPREIFSSFKRTNGRRIEVSQKVIASASNPIDETLTGLGCRLAGLTQEEAEERIDTYGPNVVSHDQRFVKLKLFLKALVNPLVILLGILAAFTFATATTTSDLISGTLMSLMIVLGVSLRFIQESRAGSAAAKLRAMIRVTATVLRDGTPVE
ncbi:MAG: cation-transporting P-type ATPase, partial [Candidatus Kapaibacterium sp.]